MNYNTIEELVILAKNNNIAAKEKLIEEFRPFIINLASKTYIHGYDNLDIQNECYQLLFKSLKKYDVKKHRFVAYATITIKNGIYLLIRNSLNHSKTDGSSSLTFDGDLENLNLFFNTLVEDNICKLCEKQELRQALNALSIEEQELIKFVFISNNTLKEYSDFKNIPYSTASYRKSIALKKLNSYITELNKPKAKKKKYLN